jgi:hypothetical protein
LIKRTSSKSLLLDPANEDSRGDARVFSEDEFDHSVNFGFLFSTAQRLKMGAGASSHVKKLHKEILQEAIKRKVGHNEAMLYFSCLSLPM